MVISLHGKLNNFKTFFYEEVKKNCFLFQGDWQKGKLSCPNCNLRVGSFDFICGMKCPCKKFVLPQIHMVKSKVDIYFH